VVGNEGFVTLRKLGLEASQLALLREVAAMGGGGAGLGGGRGERESGEIVCR